MSNDQLKNNSKILIIEDDAFLAQLLVDYFKKEGLNFDLASDGENGLAKARAGEVDLILLDLVLPGIDGYEVLEQLKKDMELAKIPVIILSNLGLKEEIERGFSLGAVDFLVKAEIDLDEVVIKIKQILERSKQTNKE